MIDDQLNITMARCKPSTGYVVHFLQACQKRSNGGDACKASGRLLEPLGLVDAPANNPGNLGLLPW